MLVVHMGGFEASMTNNTLELIRGFVRPVISIIFAAVIAQVVVEGIEAPEWFLALAIGCITWWFGDRTVRRIKEKRQEGK